jgi:sialate O-acetylesterase
MKTLRLLFFSILLAGLYSFSTFASTRLPKVIGSNMVLQQKQAVPVWGWSEPGQPVSVSFAGQEKKTVAAADGSWKIVLNALKASAQPRDLVITAGERIVLSNVLVGEVWLCSGQSNMEYPMKNTYAKPQRGADSLELQLSANYPAIRLFKVEKVLSTPDVTSAGWNACSGDALAAFSAAGYFFAKEIYKEVGVPVGMIQAAWGGSRIEPWTPAEGYKMLPAFSSETIKSPLKINGVDPGKNFKSMVEPLAPFAIRGFLWYQGESNCMIEDGMHYADKMQALVQSWRSRWGNEKLPFYSVQIAPYYYTKRNDALKHTPETLAEFWEAQSESQKIPYTAMITVTDLVDNLSEIHPPYKWEVGRRLALLALANDYGRKHIEARGPVFKKMKIENGRALLSFTHANGLRSSNGQPLNCFTICGADGKFVPAEAVIKNGVIEVNAAGISTPTAVRFAWNETAQPNLENATGLPAVSFRTDALVWNPDK